MPMPLPPPVISATLPSRRIRALLSAVDRRAQAYAPRASVCVVKVVTEGDVAGVRRTPTGGTLWVWLDPHGGLGGPALIYLDAATERPGPPRATSRMRSARRPHRFKSFDADGFELLVRPRQVRPARRSSTSC